MEARARAFLFILFFLALCVVAEERPSNSATMQLRGIVLPRTEISISDIVATAPDTGSAVISASSNSRAGCSVSLECPPEPGQSGKSRITVDGRHVELTGSNAELFDLSGTSARNARQWTVAITTPDNAPRVYTVNVSAN